VLKYFRPNESVHSSMIGSHSTNRHAQLFKAT